MSQPEAATATAAKAAAPPSPSSLAGRMLLIRQLALFTLIGAAGLPVDIGAYYLGWLVLGFGDIGSAIFSFFLAATFTFWLNRRFTFRMTETRGLVHQWFRFLMANAIGAVANRLTFVLLITHVPLINEYRFAGLIIGSAVGLVFNFTLSKLVVFRDR